MRAAVLSDIHGFSLALETVLADIDAKGPVDEVVVAGDLCEGGPDPARVLELLQERDVTVLTGNTDADIVEGAAASTGGHSVQYAIDHIGPKGIAYLASLPFSKRITPPGGSSPADDLLVVHANPRNLLDHLTPGDSDRAVRDVLGDELAGAVAFGHYHVCFIRTVDRTLLVDVSAVGNPKDGDLRCKYGILTWSPDARAWSADIQKLEYHLEATERQILASSLPDPRKTVRKLKKASY